MRQRHAPGEQAEVRRVQPAIGVTIAVLRVLNVGDDAIGLVVHQHEHDFALVFDGRGEFTEIDHRSAVAKERDRLSIGRGERGANRHRDALADAAAKSVNAQMRRGQFDVAIAEHRIRDGDVPRERMRAGMNPFAQDVRQRAVGTE